MSKSLTRIAKRKNNKYILIDEKLKELIYRKRNEKLARCLYEFKILKMLIFLHNVYDHFTEDITLRRIINQFF